MIWVWSKEFFSVSSILMQYTYELTVMWEEWKIAVVCAIAFGKTTAGINT